MNTKTAKQASPSHAGKPSKPLRLAASRPQETETMPHTPDAPDEVTRNLFMILEKSREVLNKLAEKQARIKPTLGISDPLHVSHAFAEMFSHLLADPEKLVQAQCDLWKQYLALYNAGMRRFLGEPAEPVATPQPGDKRFRDPAWQDSLVFDILKQSYLLTSSWMQQTVHGVKGLDDHTRRKVEFYTRQFVDALSPSNFLLTNPEALRETLTTHGENLVHGLQHLLEDLERSKESLSIQMTDTSAFELGRNIAATPGKVVYQNDLMQLIQYTPTTEKVYKQPLLLIPAWINKYYILDLSPEKSLVRYLVDEGYTVFVISWVNADERHRDTDMDDYITHGPLAAMEAIAKATGEKEISAIGYCLGGTLLAATIAGMRAKGDRRIRTATFLTTLVDFAEAGELSVFIDEEQLQSLEARMQECGYLGGGAMATTFNMLRANDLIWSYVINNYLLGREPFPFDVLYWNSDSTRMPAKMHSFYLRNMYQKNLLARPGGLTLMGVPIDLRKVDIPTYILSTREDHISPWKSTYSATQIYSGKTRFVLAASGHVVGVVNPPSNKKYGHWVNDAASPPLTADAWMEGAREVAGSWWPDWKAWNAPQAGGMVPARKPGEGGMKVIEDAPGSYVRVKA